jgi:hypothetical protein
MSTQEEAAAKWEMFENYKKAESRYAAVASKVRIWGQEFAKLSGASGNPNTIMSLDLSKLPEKQELLDAQREMRDLNASSTTFKAGLLQAGMDLK